MSSNTLADSIIAQLQRAGVRRLFGMPGGGSNADLVEAAARAGLPFTLAHTETAGAFMASAQAELTGCPGACIATLGPGAASVVNGVANALLDRISLLVLTDCYDEAAAQVMQHQVLRHAELFAPITLWSARLRPAALADPMQRAIRIALGPPAGPVHLDCGPDVTAAQTPDAPATNAASDTLSAPASSAAFEMPATSLAGAPSGSVPLPELSLTPAAERALRQARRPLFLVGLGARTPPSPPRCAPCANATAFRRWSPTKPKASFQTSTPGLPAC